MKFSDMARASKSAPAAPPSSSQGPGGVAGQELLPADAVRDVLQAALDYRGKPDEQDVWGYLEISLRAFNEGRWAREL